MLYITNLYKSRNFFSEIIRWDLKGISRIIFSLDSNTLQIRNIYFLGHVFLQDLNGSLFYFFPVTVTENSVENRMSTYFQFSSRKMGARKQGYPSRPRRGRDGVYPCLRPPFYYAKIENRCSFCFPHCFL